MTLLNAVITVAWVVAGLLAGALFLTAVGRIERRARARNRRWMSEREFQEEAAAAECGEIPARHKDAA
jgi:hypothetical protein